MSANNYKLPIYSVWPQTIGDATEQDAGVMSAADKAKLDSLSPGTHATTAVRYTVQVADGKDFFVPVPVGVFVNGNYAVASNLISDGFGFVPIRQPVVNPADRTALFFRVVTDVVITGAEIEFILTAL